MIKVLTVVAAGVLSTVAIACSPLTPQAAVATSTVAPVSQLAATPTVETPPQPSPTTQSLPTATAVSVQIASPTRTDAATNTPLPVIATSPPPPARFTPTLPTAPPTPTSPAVVTPVATLAGNPARGKVLMAEKGCIACHGALGEGNYGPKIAGTSLPFEAVLEQVRRPREFMLAFSEEDLSDSGVRDIYAYLQELGR